MTLLAKLQVWTQPVWLILLFSPPIAVLIVDPHAMTDWTNFAGHSPSKAQFDWLLFGSAAGIALSLIAQIGEQADYLRFLGDKTSANKTKWWLAVLCAGPGWVVLGSLKQLMARSSRPWRLRMARRWPRRTSRSRCTSPGSTTSSRPGRAGGGDVLRDPVANQDQRDQRLFGSLSWSNFFSRVAHTHPGRVVWIFLNVAISLTMMELNMFSVLGNILGFYSNTAVAWIGAVTADLVIIKPLLKLSPSYIEFKRGHLYDFNPVGFAR